MKRLIGGFFLVLVSGVAVAGSWSVRLQGGSAHALNATANARELSAQVSQACGCIVTSSVASTEGAARITARYAFNRRWALSFGTFAASQFRINGAAHVSATSSDPITVSDRILGSTVLGVLHGHVRRFLWHVGAGLAVTRDSETSTISGGGVTNSAYAASTVASGALEGGLGYAFTRHWGLTASVLYIPTVGSSETATSGQYTNGPLLISALGASYRF